MSQSEPIRILLVDDEPSARTILRRWIERKISAAVYEAEDGLQALESVAENKIELVISDVSMPVLDGIELLRLLRTDPSWERLEVLMVSHVAAEDRVSQIIALGASDYLLKPLQYDRAIKRLLAAAERVVQRRPTERGDPAELKPKILIADPDADFRSAAERALENDFSVKSARSLAEILVHLLRWKPAAVLLSPSIPGLNIDNLNAPIAALVARDKSKLYRLDEPGSRMKGPAPGGVFAGAVQKSYIAGSFASEVCKLVLGAPHSARGAKPWTDFLEHELCTALNQTLGIMTGAEPKPVTSMPPEQAPDIYGRSRICCNNDRFELLVGIDATDGMALRLSKAMLGDDFDEELALDGFKEVLNVVAGRLKVACAERRMEVIVDLPRAYRGEEPVSQAVAEYRMDSSYLWNGEYFRIFLAVNELTPDAAGRSAESEAVAAT